MTTAITKYDEQIKLQSKDFESRLINAISENGDLDSLMTEAKEIFRVGYFTPKQYKNLTDIELYKEMLS